MRKTTVFFCLLLAALCVAEQAKAVDKKCDGKRCETEEPPIKPPYDDCEAEPPHLCLANMDKPAGPFTCRRLVIDKDPRREGDKPVGWVCLRIGPDADRRRGWLDVVYVLDEGCTNPHVEGFTDDDYKQMSAALETAKRSEVDKGMQHPEGLFCKDWRMLEAHFWISPDFDSVPTSPAGAPLVNQFPFRQVFIAPGGKFGWLHLSLDQILPRDYDFHRVCHDILWFAAQANLVCDSGDADVNPDDCNSAWAQGAHFQETRDVDGQYYYVEILCDKDCLYPHHNPYCATSYALAVPDCKDAHSRCFTHFKHENHHFTMWGWVNKLTKEGHYTFDLFAGGTSCGCDNEDRYGPEDKDCHCKPHNMGKLVGNVYVDFEMLQPPYLDSDMANALAEKEPTEALSTREADPAPQKPEHKKYGRVMVQFATKPGYYLEETEVHVSSKFPLPFTHWGNDWMHPATFPGFYRMKHEHEQLHTRIDEYFVTLEFDGKRARCAAVREDTVVDAPQKVEETVKPVDEAFGEDGEDGEAEYAPPNAQYNFYRDDDWQSQCGGYGGPEVFVIAHAMTCKGNVIMIPHDEHDVHYEPEKAPEAAPAVEAQRKK
eukprot:TRINITY_DN2091_c0_g2_i1.p1 TRINITY_DN2091_c0_g2~~TRINITY_DN2091_c0_g2_i1.p1  ORF type:complete len:599 (-),score=168.13 TRINITY_DN2091_c0_g2_i1:153-1949(-)